MQLHPDWRRLLRYAWSVRLIALAGLLTGAEAALPVIDQIVFIPRGVFAALSFVATAGAFIARLVAQRRFRHGQED